MKFPAISLYYLALFVFAIFGQTTAYSQNINYPDIDCPSGLKVNSYNLSLYYGRTDLKIPCNGISIDLTFSYSARRTAIDLGYGNAWSLDYSMIYTRDTHEVVVRQGMGRKDIFEKSGSGWIPEIGNFDTLYEYSPGKLQLRRKNGMTYSFDDSLHKRVTKISDRNGNSLLLSYTDSLATLITDPSGRSVQLSYTNGHLTSISDPNFSPPRTYSYTYDNNWNMIRYTDPMGNQINYEYDSRRRLTKLTNENSVVFEIAYYTAIYNSFNRVAYVRSNLRTLNFYLQTRKTKVVEMVNNIEQTTFYDYDCNIVVCRSIRSKSGNCCGFDESYSYDSDQNLTKKIDANLNEWNYRYDDNGNQIKRTDPFGNSEDYEYEPTYNRMISMKDKRNNMTGYSYDSQGNLLSIVYPDATNKSYTYDPSGNKISETDQRGYTTTYTYNSRGDKVLTTYPDGSTNSYAYDNVGNMTSSTDANGNSTSYVYDAFNRVIQITDALGSSVYKSYDALGNMTSMTDKLGRTTSYTYDGLNRNTRITTPVGSISMIYDSHGNRLSMTDMKGNVTTYAYDNRNLLIAETNALGHIRSFAYDPKGNKVSETDFSGNSTYYEYDFLDRIVKKTDALNNITMYGYDENGNVASMTDANGNLTTYAYDELNRLIRTNLPIGSTSLAYDGNGNIYSMTDANGRVSFKTYDNLNRVISETDPAGNTSEYEYDLKGNMTKKTDRNGNSTEYVYDALDREIQQINAMGEATFKTYNAEGYITQLQLSNGNAVSYTYDVGNRMISSTDLQGQVSSQTYDANGNRTSLTDGNGNTKINKYDALNRLIAVRDATNKSTLLTYNNNSSLVSVRDRNGNTNSRSYDALERVTSTESAFGNTTTMVYDNAGNMISVTDDNGRTTGYSYDANSRRTSETFADGSFRTYSYDFAGNLISRKDNNGRQTDYKYDELNRLLEKSHAAGSDYYTFDPEGNMLSAVNSNARVSFEYDAANRKTQENLNGKVMSYGYNIEGRRLNKIYPGGRSVTENFDIRNNLQSINSEIEVTYTYDAAERVLSRGYSNGMIANYTYDSDDRVKSVSHVKLPTVIAQFDYTFDAEGNRLTSKSIHNASGSEKYTYSIDYKLTNFKKGTLVGNEIPAPVTQTQYNYDKIGNRISINNDGNITNYTINQVNAYTNVTDSIAVSPAYDANGNTLNDGRHAYSYDYENRLVTVNGGTTAVYKYDALGRRISKILPGSTINYYYDGQRIIEERDGSDNISATYVYGTSIDDILSMSRNGTDYFYHHNSLGSVVALTNLSAIVIERYEYDAYGNPIISVLSSAGNSSTASGNAFMFTGREYDTETGNYHYRARFTVPNWGRFVQWDPLGYVDGTNFYEYAKSNPSNASDPLGLACCKDYGIDWNCFYSCFENQFNSYNLDDYYIDPSLDQYDYGGYIRKCRFHYNHHKTDNLFYYCKVLCICVLQMSQRGHAKN